MRIEWGSTRTVLLTRRWAIKLPGRWLRYPHTRRWYSFLNGLLANMQEREWWNGFTPPTDLEPTPRTHLCPVLWCAPGGLLLIMRRARPLTDSEWDVLRCDAHGNAPLVYHMDTRPEEQIRMRDGTILPGEFKHSSLGVVDGRLVVVDYGD